MSATTPNKDNEPEIERPTTPISQLSESSEMNNGKTPTYLNPTISSSLKKSPSRSSIMGGDQSKEPRSESSKGKQRAEEKDKEDWKEKVRGLWASGDNNKKGSSSKDERPVFDMKDISKYVTHHHISYECSCEAAKIINSFEVDPKFLKNGEYILTEIEHRHQKDKDEPVGILTFATVHQSTALADMSRSIPFPPAYGEACFVQPRILEETEVFDIKNGCPVKSDELKNFSDKLTFPMMDIEDAHELSTIVAFSAVHCPMSGSEKQNAMWCDTGLKLMHPFTTGVIFPGYNYYQDTKDIANFICVEYKKNWEVLNKHLCAYLHILCRDVTEHHLTAPRRQFIINEVKMLKIILLDKCIGFLEVNSRLMTVASFYMNWFWYRYTHRLPVNYPNWMEARIRKMQGFPVQVLMPPKFLDFADIFSTLQRSQVAGENVGLRHLINEAGRLDTMQARVSEILARYESSHWMTKADVEARMRFRKSTFKVYADAALARAKLANRRMQATTAPKKAETSQASGSSSSGFAIGQQTASKWISQLAQEQSLAERKEAEKKKAEEAEEAEAKAHEKAERAKADKAALEKEQKFYADLEKFWAGDRTVVVGGMSRAAMEAEGPPVRRTEADDLIDSWCAHLAEREGEM